MNIATSGHCRNDVLADPDRIIKIRILALGREMAFTGRNAQTLARLIAKGSDGISSIDHPGLRLAHYAFCLKKAGLAISCHTAGFSAEGGRIKGRYGIYTLETPLAVIDAVSSAEMQEAA